MVQPQQVRRLNRRKVLHKWLGKRLLAVDSKGVDIPNVGKSYRDLHAMADKSQLL